MILKILKLQLKQSEVGKKKREINEKDENEDKEEMSESEDEYLPNENDKERVLAKKKTKHDRFFSTFNILNKDIEDNAPILVQQMGQFDTLVSYAENEKTYQLVIDSLRLKLKAGQTQCSTLTELVEEMMTEMNTNDEEDKDEDYEEDEEENSMTDWNKQKN